MCGRHTHAPAFRRFHEIKGMAPGRLAVAALADEAGSGGGAGR